MSKPSLLDCSLLELPKIHFRAGNITPINGVQHIPFEIARVFYLYDIPGGESRGAHAHRQCHQLLVAGSGSFDVVLSDGANQKTFNLNRPYFGLYIPPFIWAEEQNFSSGSICLVLASMEYDEEDYITSYEEYNKLLNGFN